MHYFGVTKMWGIHSTALDPKWCLGVFRSILLTFGTYKDLKPFFGPECTILGYRSSEASILLRWTQMMFGCVSEHFVYLRHVERCKTCVSGLNALFRGNEVVKHPFDSIGPKMIFGCVSEHFANLRHVKRRNTCVSCLNALFRGTEVVKHPFYSIGPKMMFGCVLEHLAYLQHVKRCKTCVSGLNALFWGTEVLSNHSTPLDPKWCLGVFQSISLTFGT
jgi:hypothetical protein